MPEPSDDPIRTLLASVSPSMFLGNPSGTVAIMQERVVAAGGDLDEVTAWVKERGGWVDRSFHSIRRFGSQTRLRQPSRLFYVVPEEALAGGADQSSSADAGSK